MFKHLFFRSGHIRSVMFFSLLAFNIVCTACTEKNTMQEHCITVVGTATVQVLPDQARFSFSVVSHAETLTGAKQLHDTAIQKAHTLFNRYTIESKDITLENLTIRPHYSYRSDNPQFLYYEVQQNISVVITNLEQYELFLTDLVNSGIDRINDVRFSAKDFKKYKDEARRNAVKAAEEKAKLLCESAASGTHTPTLGKIIRISELPSYSGWDRYNAAQQNRIAYMKAESADASMEGTPIGKIAFDAQIEMVFELK